MHDNANGTRGIALIAIVLFVVGLLGPFLLFAVLTAFAKMPRESATNIAVGFAAISELLALVMGFVGWRHPAGKIAAIGSGLVAAIAVGGSFMYWLF